MGLLDDAIREHLALKRRHGADPREVERLEREALGPAGRATRVGAAGPVEEPVEESPAHDIEPPSPFVAELGDEDEGPLVEPQPTLEPVTAARQVAPAPEPDYDEDWIDEGDPDGWLDEPEPPAPDRAQAAAPAPAPDPTHDSDPAPEEESEQAVPEEEPAGEDVLEETPDFLQETPEHDRLWFEQRPPKDFDFGS